MRLKTEAATKFKTEKRKDDTWDEMAKPYMRALLLHIITAPVSEQENDGNIPANERDLITFRRFIQRGDFYAEAYFQARKSAEELAKNPISGHKQLPKRMARNMALDGIIADEAKSQLENLEIHEKLFNSIRSSAVTATAWIDDPKIRDVLRAGKYQNTFRASELETGPNGISVFVCLRLKEQKKLAAWPRRIMNMVLAAAQDDYFRSPASGHNTLMMFDEFAALEPYAQR